MRFCEIAAFTLSLTVFVAAASAEKKDPALPKIPHSHHSEQGGLVLMFGDDHLELVRSGPSRVTAHFSDKFRAPLLSTDFDHKVTLVDGGREQDLEMSASASAPTWALPEKISPQAQLRITLKRKNPPKAYVVSEQAQTVLVSRLPSRKEKTSAHH
jgi:hypothetical protein